MQKKALKYGLIYLEQGIHSVCMYVQIYVYVHENAHICICIYIYIGRFLKQIACLWVQQIFPLAEMTDHKINI